jgi:hypothetical protein
MSTSQAGGFCRRNLITTDGSPDTGGRPVVAGSGWKATGGSNSFDMVSDMANLKITITLQEDQLKQVRALVASGKATSVSNVDGQKFCHSRRDPSPLRHGERMRM